MTSCKEINVKENKKTTYQVEIKFKEESREQIVEALRSTSWCFMTDLANIIE